MSARAWDLVTPCVVWRARALALPHIDAARRPLSHVFRWRLTAGHHAACRFYPGWGLPDDACAAVGAFLRLDRRIRVATLSSNRVADDGARGRRARPCAWVALIGRAAAFVCRRGRQSPQGRQQVAPLPEAESGCASLQTICRGKPLSTARPCNCQRVAHTHPHAGAELLADGLAANRTLVTLDLSDNRIGDAGALAIAQALARNGSGALAELNLANNSIGAMRRVAGQWCWLDFFVLSTASVVLEQLCCSTALHPLQHRCQLCASLTPRAAGDEGAEALAAAAASSRTLKRIQLSGNAVSAGQLKVVQQALKTREYRV